MHDTACLESSETQHCTTNSDMEHDAGLQITAKLDPENLFKSLDVINRRFFNSEITASISWDVPQGLVSINIGTVRYELKDLTEEITFEQATKALEQGEMEKALALLTPLADKGHPDSELLVCHLLKRKQGDWQTYAKAYNDHFITEMMAPAACYYPDSQTIAIHPHLHRRDVPMFVLRYLIYHECCHQVINSSESNPHPPAFMEYEINAPFRDKALAWLEKEGFPTLQNSVCE